MCAPVRETMRVFGTKSNQITDCSLDCFDSTAANHAEQARQHAGPDNGRECASKMIPKIISLIRLPTKITWRPTRNE